MEDFMERLWAEIKQDMKKWFVWIELLAYTLFVFNVCAALIHIIPTGIVMFLVLVGSFTPAFFIYRLRKYFSKKYEEKR